MKAIVFVGPSLYSISEHGFRNIDFAPPAKCGDILKAAAQGRRMISLIDGIFEAGPAVWHKEIIFALSQGIRVYGAASMGALRAAECHAFGMVGIGKIFQDYANGTRIADADVALLHAPAELDYRPLTVPQVDVEYLLARLQLEQAIDSRTGTSLLNASGQLNFRDRTWRKIFEIAGFGAEESARLVQLVHSAGPGQKSLDALELLELLERGTPTEVLLGEYGYRETNFIASLRRRKGIGYG